MGFFDAIKGAVGAGQPTVAIHLHQAEVPRGGVLEGRATITGTQRAVPITAFDVHVVSITTGVGRLKVASERIVMSGATVQPGQTLEAPFLIQLPSGAAPSGTATSYELVLSADVPGVDPKHRAPFTITHVRDPMAGEPQTRFHVLPTERAFRHSSVRGDFRMTRMPDGFLTHWKTQLSCRNADGSLRWKVPGWGRTSACSPDGTRVAVSDRNKRMAFVDAGSGELGSPVQMPTWIDDIVFLPDGTVVCGSSEQLFVLDSHGRLVKTISELGYGSMFLASVIAGPGRVVFCADPNANRVTAVDLDAGVVGHTELRSPHTLYASGAGELVMVDLGDSIEVLDAHLRPRASWTIPGQEGVRYVGQAKHSHTRWKCHPRVSPNLQQTLLNDRSGQLWLLDTMSGQPVRQFERDVLDYVEDQVFWDEARFFAITNDGKVRGVGVDGTVWFEDQDF